MSFDDGDSVSPSSADYLQSPHEAKRKALMQKLEKQGMKNAVNPTADLKQLKLTLLKGQMDKKDDASKAVVPQKAGGTSGTKTREQEIAASKLTADAKPSAEQLVNQGAQDEKAEAELKTAEVQSEDA